MRLLTLMLIALTAISCASPDGLGPVTPSPPSDLATLPLPVGVSGIPEAGTPTAMVEPVTPSGSVPIGAPQSYTLGHCGLGSPIDFDGSLWDPVAGDDGAHGPLTQDQLGELINATPVVLTLIDATRAQFATPRGARIMLERHLGPRPYHLCD
jgi:hypothetical protein